MFRVSVCTQESYSISIASKNYTFRYVGIYIFMKPALLVRDLDLIRKICVEEFDHFSDRAKIFDKKFDTVTGNNLMSLKGTNAQLSNCLK